MNNVDKQYLDLVNDIITNGCFKSTRSGNVYSVFDRNLKFKMSDGFPLLTTKKVYVRGVLHELLWFVKGDTNIKYLVDNNVHIWDDDAYRYYIELIDNNNKLCEDNFIENKFDYISKDEFLKSVINEDKITILRNDELFDLETYDYKYGDLGDVYGKQWRQYGYSGRDQINEIIEKLKDNPNDRRILCVAYNPDVLDDIALPPCHILFQLYARPLTKDERLNILMKKRCDKYDEYKTVKDELLDEENIPKYELSLKWTQRSVDTILGLPFNIASYSFLLSMIAQCVNMTVGFVSCSLGDCHVYEAHLEAAKEQLSRDSNKFSLPTLKINPNIKDIDKFTFEDFKIENYESYPSIKAPLCVG